MTGSATAKGVKIDIDSSVSDVFTESDFAFGLQMVSEAWHRSRWGVWFNGQWLIRKVNDNLKGTPAEFDLTMNMGLFELAGAYSFGRQALTSRRDGPPWQVQPFVGVRVTVMRLKFDFHICSTPSMISLGARALSQNYSDGSGSNKFRWDVTQYGPFIALQLRF